MSATKISLVIANTRQSERYGWRLVLEQPQDFEGVYENNRRALDSQVVWELCATPVSDEPVSAEPQNNGVSRQIKRPASATRMHRLLICDSHGNEVDSFFTEEGVPCLQGAPTGLLVTDSRVGNSRKILTSSKFDLSDREKEVLVFVVEGLSNQKIADRLMVSPETIKTHVRHIMEKLSVSDRTQAAVKALREGLLPG